MSSHPNKKDESVFLQNSACVHLLSQYMLYCKSILDFLFGAYCALFLLQALREAYPEGENGFEHFNKTCFKFKEERHLVVEPISQNDLTIHVECGDKVYRYWK